MWPNSTRTIQVLHIFYEDLLLNFEATSSAIFSFLRRYLGNTIPPTEEALLCALLHNSDTQESFHRQHSPGNDSLVYNSRYHNPYLTELYFNATTNATHIIGDVSERRNSSNYRT